MRRVRGFSTELKEGLVRRIEAGERVSDLAAETGVLRSSLYQWRAAYRAMGAAGLNRKPGRKPKRGASGALGRASEWPAAAGSPSARPPDDLTEAKARIVELERVAGRQQVELDFFHEALRSWDATSRSGGAPISSPSSKK
jgi:transposase-like protein